MKTLFTVTDKHPLCRRHSLTYGTYFVFRLLVFLSFFFFNNIYLFLAATGLCCSTRASL